jgi:hypothetical protein
MFGAILGSVAGGLMNNISGSGNGGGGLLGGLGDMVGKLMDPLGLLGGNEQQGMPEEAKEMMEMMRDMIKELLAVIKEQNGAGSAVDPESPCTDDASAVGQMMQIYAGSGDDMVSVG